MESWSTHDPTDAEDARYVIREDLKLLRTYLKRCAAVKAIVERLVEPLEAPGLRKVAQRIERRMVNVERLEAMVRESGELIDAFLEEFERVTVQMARSADPDVDRAANHALSELLESSERHALTEQSTRLERLAQSIIEGEDLDDSIDWALEEYVGSETGVAARLERMAPEGLDDLMAGATGFGVMKWYLNIEIITDAAAEI